MKTAGCTAPLLLLGLASSMAFAQYPVSTGEYIVWAAGTTDGSPCFPFADL